MTAHARSAPAVLENHETRLKRLEGLLPADGGRAIGTRAPAGPHAHDYLPRLQAATAVAISGGAITLTAGQYHYQISAESGTSDELTSISGMEANRLYIFRAAANHTILVSSSNFLITGPYAQLTLNAFAEWAFGLSHDGSAVWFSKPVSGLFSGTYEATIAAGVATVFPDPSTSTISLASESGTSDDLDTLSGLFPDTLYILRPSPGDTITLKHGTGNLLIMSSADIVLDENQAHAFALVDPISGNIFVFGYNLTHLPLAHGMVDGAVASTTVPYALVGPMPRAGGIVAVHAKLNENKTCGATPWIGDVHKVPLANANTDGQGTTIYTTQSNRPTITNGNMYTAAALPDVTAFAAGDWFMFYTDQAGTNVATVGIGLRLRFT